MKKYLFLSLLGLMILVFACSKMDDPQLETTSEEIELYEDDFPHDWDGEVPEEEEIIDDPYTNPGKKKYCVWTVTSVEDPTPNDNNHPKFKAGDKICYVCDDNGCTADRGIITLVQWRNFGDGCKTFGHTTDDTCQERDDCAGKYRR